MWTQCKKIFHHSVNDDNIFNREEHCCAWAKRHFLQLLGTVPSRTYPTSSSSGESVSWASCQFLDGWNTYLDSGCSTHSALWNRVTQSDSHRKLFHVVDLHCVGWRLSLAGREGTWGPVMRRLIANLNYQMTHENIEALIRKVRWGLCPLQGFFCYKVLVSHSWAGAGMVSSRGLMQWHEAFLMSNTWGERAGDHSDFYWMESNNFEEFVHWVAVLMLV